MNRPRLQILADHLRSLPDDAVRMDECLSEGECGTVACISGWIQTLWNRAPGDTYVATRVGLSLEQGDALFTPDGWSEEGRYTRSDAVAAIQSMLDSPDDDALPVWPSREGASA